MRGQRVLTPKNPKKGSIPVFCRKTRRKCISFLGTLFIFAKYETMQIVKFSALRAEGAPRSDGNNSRCVFAALLPEGDKCQISNLQWSHPPRIFDDFLLWSHPPGILSRQTRDKLATNSRQTRDKIATTVTWKKNEFEPWLFTKISCKQSFQHSMCDGLSWIKVAQQFSTLDIYRFWGP